MIRKRTTTLNRLKAKYLDRTSKFVTIDGITIHYRDQGTGPVLVLLHGICASLHTWDKWVEELGSHYRIIRMDIPGFGFSGPATKEIYDPDIGIEFFDKFINALGLTHFFLVGNSIGGFISWRYALKYPTKVDKLILIDPVGYSQPIPRVVWLASHPLLRPLAKHRMPRHYFNMAVKEIFGDRSKLTDELQQRYFELAMYGNNKRAYVDFFTVMRKLCTSKDLSKGIDKIQTQTLVMWGTRDRWVPYTYVHQWKKDLRNGTFISYDGVGHIPMEEIPRRSAQDAHHYLRGKSLYYAHEKD